MKKNKKILIVIYEDFKRKKVLIFKKVYLKYFLFTFSIASIGFVFFFIAYLSSTVSKHSFVEPESIVRTGQLSLQNLNKETNKYFDEINKNANKQLKFELDKDKVEIKNIDNKMNISLVINNLSEIKNNINLYFICVLRNSYLMYSYPNAFIYDTNKITLDYRLGESFTITDSKTIRFNFNVFEKTVFNTLSVFLYSEDGVLSFYKIIELGENYE